VGEDPLARRLAGNFSSIVKEQQNLLLVYRRAGPQTTERANLFPLSSGQPLVLSSAMVGVRLFHVSFTRFHRTFDNIMPHQACDNILLITT
jgi:hypothetical protein